jgi:hypothetical protein
MTEIRNLTKEEISCKVKQVTQKGALILLYKTARVDSQILDETFGAANWTNDFKEIKGHLYCGIGVKQDNGDFVWKWDCGTESQTEAEKGEASDSFKRAGFKWGIGVELYTSPFIFINVAVTKNEYGKWELEDKYQKFSVSRINTENKKIVGLEIVDGTNRVVYSYDYRTPEEKKLMNNFEKKASSTKSSKTKALNKGDPAPEPKQTLEERYKQTLEYLKVIRSEKEYLETTASVRDYVNATVNDLKKAGVSGWHNNVMLEVNRVTSLKDSIPY